MSTIALVGKLELSLHFPPPHCLSIVSLSETVQAGTAASTKTASNKDGFLQRDGADDLSGLFPFFFMNAGEFQNSKTRSVQRNRFLMIDVNT